MRRYLIPLAVMMLMAISGVQAGTVTVANAQTVAINFFKLNNPALRNTTLNATVKYTKSETNGTVDFYVFDMSPAVGFVIVAADDNVIPILGYSTESSFKTNFYHTGLNHWVNRTAANIQPALQNNAMADAKIQHEWAAYSAGQSQTAQRSTGDTVRPLCATTWDQEDDIDNTPQAPYIYNLFCPYYAPDAQRALTGCVATAMAQIMKRWNYPATGVGSFSYTDDTLNGYSNDYGVQSSNFAAHTYLWTAMPNVLDNHTTLAQDSAVDLLMYDCAVSVGMDFGDDNQDGSGANALLSEEVQYGDSFCSQYALVKYFGYDADTIRGVVESHYTSTAWIAMIEHELDMRRPVLYEGNDASQGGHAWVCDGYDNTNKFHMNWGWGGYSNGYFAVTNLTTPGNFDPVQDEDALIGIMPKVLAATTNGIAAVSNAFSFSMYPNPAVNEVVLETTGTESGLTWNVKNMLGQTILSQSADASQTHINLGSLQSGVYLVELKAGEKSTVKKLVVSK